MSDMNIWQKLAAIRREFAGVDKKQSGKSTHTEHKYYELRDIIPAADAIFEKHNVLFFVNFPEDRAIGRLIDLDDPNGECVEVTSRVVLIAEPSKFRMNEVQGLGAMITYMRRYLYMLILDMPTQDELDSGVATLAKKKETAKKAPPTKTERETIKKDLTAADGDATDLQIMALKKVLKELKEADPSQEEWIQEIALKTNRFTEISKAACENLILTVGEMLEHLKGQ